MDFGGTWEIKDNKLVISSSPFGIPTKTVLDYHFLENNTKLNLTQISPETTGSNEFTLIKQ